MERVIGVRIAGRRLERGWSQQELAERSRLSPRQIQRIENAHSKPTNQNLAAIADAFEISVQQLITGRSGEELVAFLEENTCTTCGAQLVERVHVPHEHGDTEYDLFECGASSGWRNRPCPHSKTFPAFSDYRLQYLDNGNGTVSCLAFGLTDSARAVELMPGHGGTRELARRWVERSYVQQREGHSEAEKKFPIETLFGIDAPAG